MNCVRQSFISYLQASGSEIMQTLAFLFICVKSLSSFLQCNAFGDNAERFVVVVMVYSVCFTCSPSLGINGVFIEK